MAHRSRVHEPLPAGAATRAPRATAADAARRLLGPVLEDYRGPVAVRLWNGELAAGARDAACTVTLRHPAVLRDLVLRRDVLRLAEAHLAGGIDIEGDVTHLFGLVDHLRRLRVPLGDRLQAAFRVLRLPASPPAGEGAAGAAARRQQANSRATIAHHYDLGNDFYRLWLDPEMVYSCAYFKAPGQPLAEAQRDKLDYICRKLRLGPGHTLLDIGCGWGALACWAARRYGARVHGITLSAAQQAHAAARVAAEGLADRVTIELRDYRSLPAGARYDRVVSVGMFEHVGAAHFGAYFATVRRVLGEGGLFLNQAISDDRGWRKNPLTGFVNRHVFPDGELVRISDALVHMERAGFEVLDVEALRRHYALTLRRWLDALQRHRRRAVALVGEAAWRVWRLYMAGAAHYFEEGSVNLYQVLAAPARRDPPVPLRRDELYRDPRPVNSPGAPALPPG